MPQDDTHIAFTKVGKAFGPQTVLDHVSFSIPRGSVFCLLGRSGVGKSVTLKLLIGLLEPDAGVVEVDGRSVSGLTRRELAELRRKMGFLFQQSALFDSLSVGENVSFPLARHGNLAPEEVRAEAERKLAMVGLKRDFDKMPSQLSGGMRKRAGLGRALAMDPEVLLIDEPSAGLDPITGEEIDELLLELKAQARTTLVVVTHNVPSARRIGDQLAILSDGKILAQGNVDELAASDDEMVRKFMHAEGGG